jgi:hypothetical protein
MIFPIFWQPSFRLTEKLLGKITGPVETTSWLWRRPHTVVQFWDAISLTSTASTGFMERAMGIELYSQTLSLNNARRCRRSQSQLVPSGAKLKLVQQTVPAHIRRTGEVGTVENRILAHFVGGLG